jgi:protein TonB
MSDFHALNEAPKPSPHSPELYIAITIAILAHVLILLNFPDQGPAKADKPEATIETTSFTLNLQRPSPKPVPVAPATPAPAETQPKPESKPEQVRKKAEKKSAAAPARTPQKPPEVQETRTQNTESEQAPAEAIEELVDQEYPPALSPWINDIENRYLAELRDAILDQRRYPQRARRLMQEGTVTISFLLLANGEIKEVSLEKSSGHRLLDNAAIQSLKRLKKFKPIPEELQRESWGMSIGLKFRLR